MYKRLEIVSYSDFDNYEIEYQKRFEGLATIKTGLTIRPFSKKEQRRLADTYQLFYVLLPNHVIDIEKIYKNSQTLSNFDLSSVQMQKLFYLQIIDEIQSTNDMEGVKSTRKEIKEAYDSPDKNKRFSGIVTMYSSILKNEFEKIDTLSKFRNIYDRLFLDEMSDDEKLDGELFRKKIIYVGDGNSYVHQGNSSEFSISEDLTKLIVFMNNPQIPLIIKSIITHYFFEYVHPFYDGNGRMGRFLMSSYLARKLDFLTGLSLSESVLQNKNKYEEAFSITSHPKNRGDLTPFVGTMLEIILNAQENMKIKLNKLKSELDRLRVLIDGLDLTEPQKELLYILSQDKLFDVLHTGVSNKELTEAFGGKYKRTKIDSILKSLEVMGFVKKVKSSPIIYEVSSDFLKDI
ncbi:Fic family protein [Streptococcus ruminantium]|uniref:Fic family protein n=3 Tax=Streptococcus ruminantium TaxID=1917441 RepID=A0ABU1B7H0_9STRE|nr:Fic family protein [Streptococcus ruminantium]MDQ8759009.1 Fic family protein [Streptococcus ruminantium]MDQ8769958.1 Fic family protein [Streptococcus ruminantium]MDQ8805392.1 Fic family protein [Streptococcus ruminantium]MDQ8806966.1 Fic family protein [Streptococcus ruminantium]MDQ8816550.1 Fic family protein [Streptococcus ruminantium]